MSLCIVLTLIQRGPFSRKIFDIIIYYYYHHHHRIAHFSVLVGKYSSILG